MNNIEFKNIRLSLGLTQGMFASRLGLSRETVCRIERCFVPVSHRISLSAENLSKPGVEKTHESESDLRSHDENAMQIVPNVEVVSLLIRVDRMIFDFRYSRLMSGRNKVSGKHVSAFLSALRAEISPYLPDSLK